MSAGNDNYPPAWRNTADEDRIKAACAARAQLEEILQELRYAIGKLSAFLCHDIGNGQCPDTDCWVQQERDRLGDELEEMRRKYE